jgi:hypothetical protein
VSAAETTERPPGRHDHAARRRPRRTGRQQGCWIYIPAEQLDRTGHGNGQPAPFYRVWGSARGRVTVQLYRSA